MIVPLKTMIQFKALCSMEQVDDKRAKNNTAGSQISAALFIWA
jgi:hypothetical protein